MKFYDYRLIILIVLGFTLLACTSLQEKSSTIPNKPEIESKDITKSSETDQKKGNLITVYKSPDCDCCTSWESYMSKAGFTVTSKTTDAMTEIKKQYGVPEKMQSCHTALIDGYVIEGHVPASDVKKLLETLPDVVGLAAPGMPAKSPGMQPEGEMPANYDVFSFDRQGNIKVFASY